MRPSTTTPDWIAETVAELPALATMKETAAVLRTTPRNLHRYISAGRLRAVRAGGTGPSRLLFPRSEIARFLRACAGET